MKIQTPCLVWWLITGAYGGKVLANGQIQLFSNDFQNVLSQNFIDCADNIELNLKFDEINKESSIVDYHRCETFDNFESCCCSFLDKIKALCQGEDENIWYLEAQLKEACLKADKLKFQEEGEIDDYLKKLENEIELQTTLEHSSELKFIEINKRSELPIFAKEADFEGQEFSWNSYSAKDNLGPAVEFNQRINFESSSGGAILEYQESDGERLLKREDTKKGSFVSKSNKAKQFDLFNADLYSGSILATFPTPTLSPISTTTISGYTSIITSTESITRYVKTVTMTETETYDIYDLTVTFHDIVEVTKTLRNKVIETIYVTETHFIPSEVNVSAEAISGTFQSLSLTGSTSTVLDSSLTTSVITLTSSNQSPSLKLTSSPTRIRVSDEKTTERKKSVERPRDGYFHQKLLAQKNLKMQNKK